MILYLFSIVSSLQDPIWPSPCTSVTSYSLMFSFILFQHPTPHHPVAPCTITVTQSSSLRLVVPAACNDQSLGNERLFSYQLQCLFKWFPPNKPYVNIVKIVTCLPSFLLLMPPFHSPVSLNAFISWNILSKILFSFNLYYLLLHYF